MVAQLPANVNLSTLLSLAPGVTCTGTEPIETVQNGSSVGITISQMASAIIANAPSNSVSFSQLPQVAGLSVVGVAGSATANIAGIAGTAGQVLRVNDAGNALAFGQVNLASAAAVTGTLPVSYGGIGTATFTTFSVLFAGSTATGPIQQSPATTAGYPLVSNGSASLATFQSVSLSGVGVTGVLPLANGGTNGSTVAAAAATLLYGSFVTAPQTVNFAVSGDTSVPIVFPTNFTRVRALGIAISAPSTALTTATFAMYTASSAGGAQVIATTSCTIATTSNNLNNNYQFSTPINQNTEAYTPTGGNLFFRVIATTAGTASIVFHYHVVP